MCGSLIGCKKVRKYEAMVNKKENNKKTMNNKEEGVNLCHKPNTMQIN